MDDRTGPSRREFLHGIAGGVALGAALPLVGGEAEAQTSSKVVTITDPALRPDGNAVDPARLGAMLDRAMQTYFGTADAISPWTQVVRPGQVVGLKVNTIAGRGLSTNVLLAETIALRLQQAGIKPHDIVIWDRTSHELERAGYRLSQAPDAVRCMGTDAVGYEDEPESFGAVRCRLSKILTRVCDVVVNVPLLKDHSYSGVTLALKNMYGVIDNPEDCHDHGCNPGVADVNMLPGIRKKVQFTVADLTTTGYEGGPGYRPQYAWKRNGLMVGKDPVAMDYVGWQIIEGKRAEQGLETLESAGRPPRYIATAADASHRLGVNDPQAISVVEA